MRIQPLEPPFPDDVAPTLARMMPGGLPPIALFRTFAHNPAMTDGVHGWGSYYLSRRSSLDLRTRELVIDRTTARCGCEYEWGVHIAYFAERVGLTPEQVRSLTVGGPGDPCWTDERDRLTISLVDELYETSTVGDDLWRRLADAFPVPQLLDMMLLTGWYHAISYVARGVDLDPEPFAARFADVG
jgi:alkylhydroperoxidase/carboxymuconolactone decarboxylase family protein YurZ